MPKKDLLNYAYNQPACGERYRPKDVRKLEFQIKQARSLTSFRFFHNFIFAVRLIFPIRQR